MRHQIRIEGLVISSQSIIVSDFTDCYDNIVNNINIRNTAILMFDMLRGFGKQSDEARLIINELSFNFEECNIDWLGTPNENFEIFNKEFQRLRKLLAFS